MNIKMIGMTNCHICCLHTERRNTSQRRPHISLFMGDQLGYQLNYIFQVDHIDSADLALENECKAFVSLLLYREEAKYNIKIAQIKQNGIVMQM